MRKAEKLLKLIHNKGEFSEDFREYTSKLGINTQIMSFRKSDLSLSLTLFSRARSNLILESAVELGKKLQKDIDHVQKILKTKIKKFKIKDEARVFLDGENGAIKFRKGFTIYVNEKDTKGKAYLVELENLIKAQRYYKFGV